MKINEPYLFLLFLNLGCFLILAIAIGLVDEKVKDVLAKIEDNDKNEN